MQEYAYSKMKWFKYSYLSIYNDLNILNVGSFDKYCYYDFKSIFNHQNWKYEGLDMIDGDNVDITVKNIYSWDEIDDNSYDVVISCQFLNQTQFYWQILSEIKRIIKPGGYICIILSNDENNQLTQNNLKINEIVKLYYYFDFDIIHTSDNKKSSRQDICIVARNNFNNISLESKLNDIHNKKELLLNFKKVIDRLNHVYYDD